MPTEQNTLPPPLMTSTPGSFARKTIFERKPRILSEVAQAYSYPPDIQAGLVAFAAEIRSETIRPLRQEADDRALWDAAWAPFEGQTWLDVPWYFAETFFYRRLIEIVRFFEPGPWQDVDPFAPQKAEELERALPAFISILDQTSPDRQATWTLMMYDTLWGNRADLSNRTILATAMEGMMDRQANRLLIDDTPQIWRYLSSHVPARVDLVTDNSGLELLLDLRLVDFMVQHMPVREVHIHLKHMPFFVSDAMIRDLAHTLERLDRASYAAQALSARLRQAIDEGRIMLRDDPFWSTCLSYHQLSPAVRQELSASDLVLFKGDVNYRRLLDDRQWPHTAHLSEILPDFPAPFVALRTLKGELIVDLGPGQAEELAASDSTWMINGRRGLIQFVEGR